MKRMRLFGGVLVLILTLGLAVVWAVSAQEGEHSEEEHQALVERGAELFVLNGCVGCHGQNGVGTDIAPALPGHNEWQIRRQVRAPLGIMPPFPPERVTEEDLQALIAYITSLEMMEDMEHSEHAVHEGVAPGDVNFAHHWLLWLALQRGDVEDALHQTAHILELVESTHMVQMQEVLTALTTGDLETAMTIVEPMITDVGTFSEDPGTVALQVVYLAVANGDGEVAEHFITEYLQSFSTDENAELAETLMALLEEGDQAGMLALLQEVLGDDLNFTGQEVTMDMEGMTHDEPEGDNDHVEEGDDHDDDMDMSDDDHDDDMDMEDDHDDDGDHEDDDHDDD